MLSRTNRKHRCIGLLRMHKHGRMPLRGEQTPLLSTMHAKRSYGAHRRRDHELYEQLQDGKKDLDLTPQNIQAVVETALELAKQPPLQRRILSDPLEGRMRERSASLQKTDFIPIQG